MFLQTLVTIADSPFDRLPVVAVIAVVVLAFVWRVNRLRRRMRERRTRNLLLFRYSLPLILIAGCFVYVQFVGNKGPSDLGATWHAGKVLAEKCGSRPKTLIVGFDKDADQSGSGTYRLRFAYSNQQGNISCHYNKVTGEFDHDEIVPDK